MNTLLPCLLLLFASAPLFAQAPPPPRPGRPHPLPPGVYEISPVHSNLCLTHQPAAGTRVSFINQTACVGGPPDLTLSEQRVHVIPATGGGYFVQVGFADQCATVARGVVFGPSSIDVLPCQTPENTCAANPADQIFRIAFLQRGRRDGSAAAGDVYEVRTANNECWDIQNRSSSSGVDVIRWACNDQTNQRFRFNYIAPLQDRAALACARRAGW